MKKKWIGIIASILTVCMLTMGAFAATTTVTISKGQGSKLSSKLSGHGANFSAANYSSSTEIMQAYGMAGRAIKWSPSIQIGKKRVEVGLIVRTRILSRCSWWEAMAAMAAAR